MGSYIVPTVYHNHGPNVTTMNEVRNTESLPKNQSLAHRVMIEQRRKHGTENTYKMGCRCDDCVEVHRALQRKVSKTRQEKRKAAKNGVASQS